MAIKPLSALTPDDRDETVQIQVHRKWEFRANNGDGPILHVDMIFTDAMGNAMYAEIPAVLVDQKAHLLQVNNVYTIKRFKIARAKSTYRSVDASFMMYITFYSIIELCHDPPSSFPQYVYHIRPYNDIDPHGPDAKNFHDVLGILNEVSPIESKEPAAQPSSSQFRNVFIKDLSDNMLKLTLWGDKALHFSYDSVYDPEKQKPIVILFVGCLPKEFRGNIYLSGTAACHWYFNPAIEEARPFYDRIQSANVMLQLPPTPKEQLPLQPPPEREHMTLKEILDLGPYGLPKHGCHCTVTITAIIQDSSWWYVACARCMKSMRMDSTGYQCQTCGSTEHTFRYRLNINASDETAECKMFCYENVGKAIVGRPCSSLVTFITATSSIPPQLAAIVSLKFTFAVVFTADSYDYEDNTLLIKSVVASHGRDRALPQLQQRVDLPCPSTPMKSVGLSRHLDSPSFALSKLSPATPSSASRMLTYSPARTAPSLIPYEPPKKRTKQGSSQADDTDIHPSEETP